MNIQIFGSSKSFDSKKAERWFKERRIKYQYIDLPSYQSGDAAAAVRFDPPPCQRRNDGGFSAA